MEMAEKWEVITCDDGRLIVATPGDIVCHQDPNHAPGDTTDVRRFHLIAAAPAMLETVKLHVAYEALPQDRGGRNGPKGKAWAAFIAARDAVLATAEVAA
jgi:hypothetical protein